MNLHANLMAGEWLGGEAAYEKRQAMGVSGR
jgi:hypothetical protein